MRGGKRERIEKTVDLGAASVLAAAVGFSLLRLLPSAVAQPYILAGCSGIAVFLLSFRFLRGFGSKRPDFKVRAFELRNVSFDEAEELLLTDQIELVLTEADRLRPQRSAEDELVLNDILEKLGPQSRVVRLFDPAAMPTPAQLNDRIERHLRAGSRPAPPADASEALYQALDELRRSLR